ncbi:hypothetical protein WR25_15408 [Diploscapter pachys]|uniref:Uncharacterized protein n=1 Tax=Diploscapter pachys TaxID=2018661 RepID=A0A2A2LNL6_9BILA|nr:hypothetical protein WR25_15408 [Diploscapter pachys]
MIEKEGINGRNGNGERVRGINRGIEENNSESEMEARKRETRRESLKERGKECRKGEEKGTQESESKMRNGSILTPIWPRKPRKRSEDLNSIRIRTGFVSNPGAEKERD